MLALSWMHLTIAVTLFLRSCLSSCWYWCSCSCWGPEGMRRLARETMKLRWEQQR